MPRTVYSTLLFAEKGLTGPVTIGPVPAGQVWVLRDLDVYANTGLLQRTQLFLEGTLGQTIAFFDWEQDTEASKQWSGRQVIEDSHTAVLVQSGDTPVDVTLSGYVLLQP